MQRLPGCFESSSSPSTERRVGFRSLETQLLTLFLERFQREATIARGLGKQALLGAEAATEVK